MGSNSSYSAGSPRAFFSISTWGFEARGDVELKIDLSEDGESFYICFDASKNGGQARCARFFCLASDAERLADRIKAQIEARKEKRP